MAHTDTIIFSVFITGLVLLAIYTMHTKDNYSVESSTGTIIDLATPVDSEEDIQMIEQVHEDSFGTGEGLYGQQKSFIQI